MYQPTGRVYARESYNMRCPARVWDFENDRFFYEIFRGDGPARQSSWLNARWRDTVVRTAVLNRLEAALLDNSVRHSAVRGYRVCRGDGIRSKGLR